jgi:hypothetical protein
MGHVWYRYIATTNLSSGIEILSAFPEQDGPLAADCIPEFHSDWVQSSDPFVFLQVKLLLISYRIDIG